MSSSHAAANRFNMRCAVCGQQRNRKGWFKPQWEAEKPVVHHYSGDYDRCKECYYNLYTTPPAPPTNEDQRTGATATALCVEMRLQAKRCGIVLKEFMERWIAEEMHNEPVNTDPLVFYREYGTVDCELMTPSNMSTRDDGRLIQGTAITKKRFTWPGLSLLAT